MSKLLINEADKFMEKCYMPLKKNSWKNSSRSPHFTQMGSLIHENEMKYLTTARNLGYYDSQTRKSKLQADNRSIFLIPVLIF